MRPHDPPRTACWHHQGLRLGFEVAYFAPEAGGFRVEGTTTGLQDGDTWVVAYRLLVDESWSTRQVRVRTRSESGWREDRIESDGKGHWAVNGDSAGHLEGCLDVDLEGSALTNALPVRRLGLSVGHTALAPAAYVAVVGEEVGRLEQRYTRIEDHAEGQRYDYEAPAFEFRCRLVYDRSGLVLDYPGIAVRAG